MARQVIAWTALCGLLAGVVLGGAGCGEGDDSGAQPEEAAGTTTERLWYHEAEFAVTPGIRAKPDQVVILHLEPEAERGRRMRNTIPYLFPETATFNFCVPQEAPRIVALRLVREDTHGVVVRLPWGTGCKTRTIEAGRYQLQVDHDGTDIPAAGKKAFVHVPRLQGAAPIGSRPEGQQVGGTLSSFPSPCDPSPINNPLFTFTAPNGMFVNPIFTSTNKVQTMATADVAFGWSICPDSSGNVTLTNPGSIVPSKPVAFFSSGPPNTDTTLYTAQTPTQTPTPFKLIDIGNGQFTLAAYFSGTLYPIVLGTDNILHWAAPGTSPAVFTAVLKFYEGGATVPPLQPGEVALFRGCNYSSGVGTWVFNTNTPNFGVFKFGTIPMDNSFGSVKVAPPTSAILFADANYGGQVQIVAEDTSCLSGTPIGTGASSLKIMPYQDFLVATDACQNCNLSGLDLSGLELAGGQFQGSTFTGANLTNTNFQSASFNNANLNGVATRLTGTNFKGALLRCTNFSGADLSHATFQDDSGVVPILTTDFSCRVDLTGATFNLSTFPLSQWRYFNLSGAQITGVTGAILSTTTSPLNLSGAMLNDADLSQVRLDGANLGCAVNPDNGSSVCTQLLDTVLTAASLRQASLVNALLQGAHLDFANLDGANLCGAKLNESPTRLGSATLQGAFLRNVNLASADLTGATLSNANFYSSFAPNPSCLPANCGPTSSCASASGATLTSAKFTDAYLNGVDFSSSTLQNVDFSGAALAGVNFTGANLSHNTSTGSPTDFTGAALQGATFTKANVEGAIFTSAVVDANPNSKGATVLFALNPTTHIAFPGYQPEAGSTLGCVEFTYSHPTKLPGTDVTNLCPDGTVGAGADGSCTTTQWQMPKSPPPPLPANCYTDDTGGTVDFNWLFD
jgi:uncharacterized protein YjbI with pentapeptide repeats